MPKFTPPCKKRTIRRCKRAPESCKVAKGIKRGPYCRKSRTIRNRSKSANVNNIYANL